MDKTYGKKDKRLDMRVSSDVLERLDAIAETLGLSRTAVITLLIMTYGQGKTKNQRGDTTTPPLGNQ